MHNSLLNKYFLFFQQQRSKEALQKLFIEISLCNGSILYLSEAYSEPSWISKREFFAKIINSLQQLTIFEKSSFLDNRLGSDYASASRQNILWNIRHKVFKNEPSKICLRQPLITLKGYGMVHFKDLTTEAGHLFCRTSIYWF